MKNFNKCNQIDLRAPRTRRAAAGRSWLHERICCAYVQWRSKPLFYVRFVALASNRSYMQHAYNLWNGWCNLIGIWFVAVQNGGATDTHKWLFFFFYLLFPVLKSWYLKSHPYHWHYGIIHLFIYIRYSIGKAVDRQMPYALRCICLCVFYTDCDSLFRMIWDWLHRKNTKKKNSSSSSIEVIDFAYTFLVNIWCNDNCVINRKPQFTNTPHC